MCKRNKQWQCSIYKMLQLYELYIFPLHLIWQPTHPICESNKQTQTDSRVVPSHHSSLPCLKSWIKLITSYVVLCLKTFVEFIYQHLFFLVVFFRNAGLQCCLRNTQHWPFMPALPTPSGKALLFSSSANLERLEFTPTVWLLCGFVIILLKHEAWEWHVKCNCMRLIAVSSYQVHKSVSVEDLRTTCLPHPTPITTFTVTGLHFYFHICFCAIFWDPSHKQGFGSTQKEQRVKI